MFEAMKDLQEQKIIISEAKFISYFTLIKESYDQEESLREFQSKVNIVE